MKFIVRSYLRTRCLLYLLDYLSILYNEASPISYLSLRFITRFKLRMDSENSRTNFLRDLTNYIPVGSATVTPDLHVRVPSNNWAEATNSLFPIHREELLSRLLLLSLEDEIVRVFSRRHQINHEKITVRIYGRIVWVNVTE